MHLLIPAAGVGRRMGSDHNKLLIPLLARPILAWTLSAAESASHLSWIGIICQPIDRLNIEAIVAQCNIQKPVQFIQGGDTRQASVFNGLQALPKEATHVLIHDGARCLATPALFDRCAQAALASKGFIAAVPVKDTIKQVDAQNLITDTPDRSRLWAAQTPQGFEVALLKQCHARGRSEGWQVTDDAALLEKCGVLVSVVKGEETNLKVTTPVDLAIAQFILQQRKTAEQGDATASKP
ncbi:2-C-methyl-D-erythritol 4-phosphate cytidylyltransferase [cf. Phormidesmis sp. LEGE 11477]|uniref:2-C-methyl-D-erythritol 4-phosphate cytidylyltransferase n=1 Tax=cf. Phormidesmis sp. LEGE 11477 TaxID=1828680 RepID=UPI0018806D0B|nr:2-C-methyl-D-erythritol 4-phosphate cytidylyltransferase [cf. Phormidesmis sp. LEGE 11477]MBE9063327.1 2-C-methyl-D-erythritol 4-phosphate cytidylyltransferase [cf. Phormidesmis sp. LEGE 11477]